MVEIITPDNADFRWGPEPYALLDYYRNPTRVGVDATHPNGQNPCMLLRHGGGGISGDYRESRDNLITGLIYDAFYFPAWLSNHAEAGTGTQGNPASGLFWDVISFDSGQMSHFDSDTGAQTLFTRSRSLFFPDAIFDCQRAIATIKSHAITLGFNPHKLIGYGESHGSTLLSLSQLYPPMGGAGRRSVARAAARRPLTHDSTLRGVVMSQAQVDCRNISGTDYLLYSNMTGWAGTNIADGGAEWNAVASKTKDSWSIRKFFEAGDLDSYPGFFVGNVVQGNHVKPYANPHDSEQHTELIAAMTAAGLTEGTGRTSYGQQLRNGGDWDNSAANGGNWPNGPSGAVLASMQVVETWMAAQVA